MRILVVAPYALTVPGGNSTSIRRLVRSAREVDPSVEFAVAT